MRLPGPFLASDAAQPLPDPPPMPDKFLAGAAALLVRAPAHRPMENPMTHTTGWTLAIALLAALTACERTGTAVDAAPATTGAQSGTATIDAQPATAGMTIAQAWARATPPNAPVAAGYVTLRNDSGSDDRLLEVRSEAVDRVEIHEVRHEDGMARMRQLPDGLPVAAGDTLALRPGGYHLMFIGPGDGFIEGSRIRATLVFQRAGNVGVEFEVRALAAAAPEEHDHH